jgi:signal transduction histidine kinase
LDNPVGAGSRLYSTKHTSPRGSYSATSWSRGLQSEVLGNLAHELRTPIQVLLGYLEILRDEFADDLNADRRGMIDRMNTNAYDLAQTIENLMDFVLSDADPQAGPEEDISLGSLLADVTPPLEAANLRKQLNIRFETERAPKIIRAPRRTLRAIIVNLALNAIKFTDAGTVTISIKPLHADGGGDLIEIEVEDTGPGVSAALLEKATKPFAQLSDSSHRRYRGLGLGLTLVQRHAAAIGGKLELRSKVGQGAKFAVRFPLRTGGAAEKPMPSRAGSLAQVPQSTHSPTAKPEKPLRR